MPDVVKLARETPAHSDQEVINLNFTLLHWVLWQSEAIAEIDCWPDGEILPCNNGRSDVGFLPPMQSRRLSPLATAACAVDWRCRQVCGNMPAVYYSKHGENQYYFDMMQGLAAGEGVSPSRFSLSVHNAIAGLCSYHSASHLPYVVLAGGTEGVFAAFLELGGLLMEAPKALLVCYEQALPLVYQAYQDNSKATWAVAMALGKAGGLGRQLRLTRRLGQGGFADEDNARTFARAILEGRRHGECRLLGSIWHWSLEDA